MNKINIYLSEDFVEDGLALIVLEGQIEMSFVMKGSLIGRNSKLVLFSEGIYFRETDGDLVLQYVYDDCDVIATLKFPNMIDSEVTCPFNRLFSISGYYGLEDAHETRILKSLNLEHIVKIINHLVEMY